ncbi:IS3 family transposase [Actinomyces massiliensis]|uniref:IS3 family transposase n=1 Tax=Actinomyces massiliensis TaxID=461393 RepID=UPI0039F6EFA9
MGQKKYPDELRERATRMTLDALADPARAKGAIRRIADELGVHPEALRTWVKKAQIDQGTRPGTTTDEAQRIKELEKEVRELRRANAILKSASGFLRGGARPPISLICQYIDSRKKEFGVEPICKVLTGAGVKIAPSTYYAAKTRPLSARSLRDENLKAEISRVHKDNYSVLGARKMHVMLNRPEISERHGAGHVARCTVERLMADLGLHGIRRAKSPRTTRSAPREQCPADLVKRHFSAFRPNELWVADITYVRTFSGWVYVAFVTDVFSRRIVGWQTSTGLYTDLALDALQMAVWQRKRAGADLTGLVHHSDRGVQYRSIRYGQALADCEAVASVGSKGDSYDNALAEALNSLYKAELIRNQGPWEDIDAVEVATAEWVHWFNTTRPHSAIGMRTPAEHEAAWAPDTHHDHHRQEQSQPTTTGTR